MKAGDQLLVAALAQAKGELEVHKANIQVYQSRPAGIGEHPEIVQALDLEVAKLADAQDKLEAVKNLLHPSRNTLTE